MIHQESKKQCRAVPVQQASKQRNLSLIIIDRSAVCHHESLSLASSLTITEQAKY